MTDIHPSAKEKGGEALPTTTATTRTAAVLFVHYPE